MAKTLSYIFPVKQLVYTDFKLRYQNSILGYLWSILKPLILFGSIYAVFSSFLSPKIEQFPLYLLSGIVLWNFLQETTLIGLDTFLIRRDLIQKLAFPREILLISSSISSSINLIINLFVFTVFYLASGLNIDFFLLLLIIPVLQLILFSLGLSLILSILHIFYRDIKYLTEVFLQILFWFTPIIYSRDILPESIRPILDYNPMAYFIDTFRLITLNHQLDPFKSLIWTATLLLFVVFGLFIFRKNSSQIAELI